MSVKVIGVQYFQINWTEWIMLDIMNYYGRQRALCGGSLSPPEKCGVGNCPPLTPPNGASAYRLWGTLWGTGFGTPFLHFPKNTRNRSRKERLSWSRLLRKRFEKSLIQGLATNLFSDLILKVSMQFAIF